MSKIYTNLMTRRTTLTRGALGTGCVLGAAASFGPASAQTLQLPEGDVRREWQEFKGRYVLPDGRVIDTGNSGNSHTESQGLGMLFAVAFDDPQTFDSILAWTAAHMRRPYDRLHAWRYQPNLAYPVADWNNATDGDLFIATALIRAAKKWGRPDHAQAASAIARDVLRLLVREAGPWLVLLPGVEGFDFSDNLTLNPSYYLFPFFSELAEVAPSGAWARLHQDGLRLMEAGRFGQWRLPPDWLRVSKADGALMPHPHWPPRFSYDAIRVPLWLAWSNAPDSGTQRAFAAWMAAHTVPPAWVDLVTDATAPYPASPGMLAVGRFATAGQHMSVKPKTADAFPSVRTSPDYYSAALLLLSRMAWQEGRSFA